MCLRLFLAPSPSKRAVERAHPFVVVGSSSSVHVANEVVPLVRRHPKNKFFKKWRHSIRRVSTRQVGARYCAPLYRRFHRCGEVPHQGKPNGGIGQNSLWIWCQTTKAQRRLTTRWALGKQTDKSVVMSLPVYSSAEDRWGAGPSCPCVPCPYVHCTAYCKSSETVSNPSFSLARRR